VTTLPDSTPTPADPTPQDPTTSSPTLEAEVPGFKTLPPPAPPDPAELVTLPPEPSPEPGAVDAGAELHPENPPSPGSSLDLHGPLAQLGQTGLVLAGIGLHARLAPEHPTAWLVDEQDVDAIVGPLARIAARHAADVAGEVSPDLADGIEAGLGVAGYMVKNAKPFRAIAGDQQQAAQVVATDETGAALYGPPAAVQQ
jgi:hypothetical protein